MNRYYRRLQNGGNVIENSILSNVLNQRNKNLNWVDRGLRPADYPVIENEDGSKSTHRLAWSSGNKGEGYVYPTIIQDENGQLKELTDDEAWEYANKTNTLMEIPSQRLADYYSQQGLIKHKFGGRKFLQDGGNFKFESPGIESQDEWNDVATRNSNWQIKEDQIKAKIDYYKNVLHQDNIDHRPYLMAASTMKYDPNAKYPEVTPQMRYVTTLAQLRDWQKYKPKFRYGGTNKYYRRSN